MAMRMTAAECWYADQDAQGGKIRHHPGGLGVEVGVDTQTTLRPVVPRGDMCAFVFDDGARLIRASARKVAGLTTI